MEPYNEASPFYSKTVSQFFTQLDERCLDMEHEIDYLKQKASDLGTDLLISYVHGATLTDAHLVGELLARIYEMPDIVSVRAYIDTVRSNSLERIAK